MPESPTGAGPVAIVTGGGSGIGRASAVSLATDGYRCVLVGRRPDMLSDTSAMLSTPGSHIALDITGRGAAEKVVARTLDEHGRIDLIVHAAGVFEKRDIGDTDSEFFAGLLDVNLGAVMELTRAAWSALCEASGQVVLVSSIAAVQGFPGNAAYAASKGGMNALGEVLRIEGRDQGVRVLTVGPGQTATDIWDGMAPTAVRERMMDPASVGGLIATLVALDRAIDVEPVVIRPMLDPWAAADGEGS